MQIFIRNWYTYRAHRWPYWNQNIYLFTYFQTMYNLTTLLRQCHDLVPSPPKASFHIFVLGSKFTSQIDVAWSVQAFFHLELITQATDVDDKLLLRVQNDIKIIAWLVSLVLEIFARNFRQWNQKSSSAMYFDAFNSVRCEAINFKILFMLVDLEPEIRFQTDIQFR